MIYSLKINIDKYLEEITLDTKKKKLIFENSLDFCMTFTCLGREGGCMWKLVNFGSAVFLPLLGGYQCFPSLLN